MKLLMRKSTVYRSKDEADWTEAKRLLTEAGIEFYPHVSEEPPAPSCGAKVDVRKFLNKKPVPTSIYQIEVAKADQPRAEDALRDKVLPVKSYGFSV